MSEATVKTRNWGNSIGITIPKEILDREKIKANEEVFVEIRKRRVPDQRIFGIAKGWGLNAQKMKDRIRKESDW